MFPLRCLRTRQLSAVLLRAVLLRAVLLRACALSLSLTLAACASDEEHRRETYGQHGNTSGDPYVQRGYVNPSQQTAMAAGAANQTGQPAQKSRQPDVEDDGLPSQVPPAKNRKRETDDPSEPYSPNYGNPHAPRPPAAQTPATQPHPPRHAGKAAPAVAGWQRSAQ